MAANRINDGFPTPGSPGDFDHRACPICGWSPCTDSCRLGLDASDLEMFESYFFEPPADWSKDWEPGAG